MKLLSNKAEIVKCERAESITAIIQSARFIYWKFTSTKKFLQCHTAAIAMYCNKHKNLLRKEGISNLAS